MDVKITFVNSYLGEEIYIEQLEGIALGQEHKVYKLLKSLYGLKGSENMTWEIQESYTF